MKIQGLILDWAGTAVDFGSVCPVAAFQQAFAGRGVALCAADVHRFMGWRKRDHLRAILALPGVAHDWVAARGSAPSDDDVEQLYVEIEDLMVGLAPSYAQLVPGLAAAVEGVRRRDLKIGSTTGYTRRIMEPLTRAAAAAGYAPDAWVAADEVRAGRPWPWMVFANLERLGLCPPAAIVKIGDTLIDLDEGRNAGTWNVSVVHSSSVVGLSPEAWQAAGADERARRAAAARAQFETAGAHYVIDELGELDAVLDRIEHRVSAGELPPWPRAAASTQA